jgi:phosphatidylinositol glycan class B
MTELRRQDYYYAYLTAVFIYVVTAIFSIGYHQSDEHFQIIEFALYKMGINQPTDLAWEFSAQLRSGFQPFLAYLFLKTFSLLGLSDPFVQMAIIRIFMGLFCLMVSLVGIKALLPSIKEQSLHQPFIILTPLLWFLPYISVRFSSETLSGSLFMLAFALVMLRRNPLSNSFLFKVPWVIIGLIFGLAFEARFQTGIMIAGFLLWMLIIAKKSVRSILLMVFGAGIGVVLGMVCSRWLYGQWCSPFFNIASMFLGKEGPNFSSQPWFYLFQEVFMNGGFVVGVIILFCQFFFWVKHFKNPVTWITLPFFAFYLLVPNKEIRFLFPVAFFLPYIIIFSSQDFIIMAYRHFHPLVKSIGYYTIIFVFILANSLFVFLFAFKPADENTAVISYLDKQYNPEDVLLLYADLSNPYDPFDSYPVVKRFYIPAKLEMYHVYRPEDVEAFYSRKDKMILLCLRKAQLGYGFWVDNTKFIKVYESLPTEYYRITRNYWEKEENALIIYQFNNCKLMY